MLWRWMSSVLIVVAEVDLDVVMRLGFMGPRCQVVLEGICLHEPLLEEDCVEVGFPSTALLRLLLLLLLFLCTARRWRPLRRLPPPREVILRPNDASTLPLRLPLHRAERQELLRLFLHWHEHRRGARRTCEGVACAGGQKRPVLLLRFITEEQRRWLKASVEVPPGTPFPRGVSDDASLPIGVIATAGAAARGPRPTPHGGVGRRIGAGGGEKLRGERRDCSSAGIGFGPYIGHERLVILREGGCFRANLRAGATIKALV